MEPPCRGVGLPCLVCGLAGDEGRALPVADTRCRDNERLMLSHVLTEIPTEIHLEEIRLSYRLIHLLNGLQASGSLERQRVVVGYVCYQRVCPCYVFEASYQSSEW